jgi:predicted TIM-barrel fold metal-dependent hydrolase
MRFRACAREIEEGDSSMNVQVADRSAAQAGQSNRLMIADCDIHPRIKSVKALYPWLSKRWQEHLDIFGVIHRQAYEKGPAFPKMQPLASRRDAFTPGGGTPGSDLQFMALQHLDPNNVELGILNPLSPSGQGAVNQDLSAAMTRAVNEWQVETWTSRDKRLKASIVIPYEDAAASVKEIERLAGHPDFAQVLILTRTAEPPGQRRYWPIYEAAAAAGLPVAFHVFGFGGNPSTSSGWPSYYIEDMLSHSAANQVAMVSLIIEGVFERIPKLKVILVEGGFAWAPALMWRMDAQWRKLKQETPHLQRLPSDYMKNHIWFTTQPIEEPEPREHLLDTIEWMGWDRLLFATDYPHWDYDDPAHALPLRISEERRQQFFRGNAQAVYARS